MAVGIDDFNYFDWNLYLKSDFFHSSRKPNWLQEVAVSQETCSGTRISINTIRGDLSLYQYFVHIVLKVINPFWKTKGFLAFSGGIELKHWG